MTDFLMKYPMQCNGTASLDAFFEHFRSDSRPTYVSLFCCGCSTATISVAAISHYWNIPQVCTVEMGRIMVGFNSVQLKADYNFTHDLTAFIHYGMRAMQQAD